MHTSRRPPRSALQPALEDSTECRRGSSKPRVRFTKRRRASLCGCPRGARAWVEHSQYSQRQREEPVALLDRCGVERCGGAQQPNPNWQRHLTAQGGRAMLHPGGGGGGAVRRCTDRGERRRVGARTVLPSSASMELCLSAGSSRTSAHRRSSRTADSTSAHLRSRPNLARRHACCMLHASDCQCCKLHVACCMSVTGICCMLHVSDCHMLHVACQ